MEHQQTVHVAAESSSRPSLGFPLGTALLLIVIFTLSGVFSCCYHWDKLRSLRRPLPDHDPPSSSSSSKPTAPHMVIGKQEMEVASVTVIMPGDDTASFIALPSPRQPYLIPPRLLPRPPNPKPPLPIPTLTPFPIPLYI